MAVKNSEQVWFESCLTQKTLIKKINAIELIICDIDGSLTDATAYYSDAKEIQKGFSIQDGYAISKCNKPGMPHIAFLSGRIDVAAKNRATALNIPKKLYFEGINSNKTEVIVKLQKALKCPKSKTIMFGDDTLDLETKDTVELFISPNNAPFYIQSHANLVVPRSGGAGAFRLLLDLILFVQKKHFAQTAIESTLK